MKKEHREEGEYSCGDCDKKFMTESGLTHHKRTYCGKEYPHSVRVKRDPDKVDKVFPCDLCDKVYPFKENLKRHHRTDHEKVRYPCPYCDKVYTQAVVRRLHIKRVHTNVKVELTP